MLDLGDDRFWLLPRDLADRTLLFTMRHGISRVESKTHRGRSAAGQSARRGTRRSTSRCRRVRPGADGRRRGTTIGFSASVELPRSKRFLHFISHSPNTRSCMNASSAP